MQSPETEYPLHVAATSSLPVVPRENDSDAQDTSIIDKLHPAFSSPEGDVILSARGGQTFFRVHSYTLKTTSGFFKEMYSLPQ